MPEEVTQLKIHPPRKCQSQSKFSRLSRKRKRKVLCSLAIKRRRIRTKSKSKKLRKIRSLQSKKNPIMRK